MPTLDVSELNVVISILGIDPLSETRLVSYGAQQSNTANRRLHSSLCVGLGESENSVVSG
jgi:hypothetical protein